ncbi:MAG TPA: carboxypeptidase regulatory-like domain-containing protein [Gemmatimonadetes bacterium]|jgi:hypothetical protein|nr:carboxypeptidase regulatory-like domain-containing protein [Gemmatimonadota bacterium]
MIRVRFLLGIQLALSLPSVLACDDFFTEDLATGPVMCTKDMRAGIVLTVVDEVTGNPALSGSTITLQDQSYVETLPQGSSAGAWERKGNYDIIISHPDYLTWLRQNVLVTADECHVHTVEIEAKLKKRT